MDARPLGDSPSDRLALRHA
jgi:hypothetical protein